MLPAPFGATGLEAERKKSLGEAFLARSVDETFPPYVNPTNEEEVLGR
ncbi:MAG: hypothetical protein IJ932_04380 [Ruminococcus sp.]|nr:hypothetical protein [Ruminococcus sp.]